MLCPAPVHPRFSLRSLAWFVLVVLPGCGGRDEPRPEAAATPAEAMAQMANALQGEVEALEAAARARDLAGLRDAA